MLTTMFLQKVLQVLPVSTTVYIDGDHYQNLVPAIIKIKYHLTHLPEL